MLCLVFSVRQMIRSLKFRSRSTVHHRGRGFSKSVHTKWHIKVSRSFFSPPGVGWATSAAGSFMIRVDLLELRQKFDTNIFLFGAIRDAYDDYMVILDFFCSQDGAYKHFLQLSIAYECFVMPLQMEALRSRTRFICTYFTVESTRAPVTFGYIWIKDRPTSRFGCFLASGS